MKLPRPRFPQESGYSALVVALACILNISAAFAAPVITATKDDNTPAGTRKVVGDQITYTITIQNTGDQTATGVQFTDPDPANTTFVSVNSTPLARNDSYSTVGNIQISVPAGNGLLVNDNDPDGGTPTVTSINTAGTEGNVTFNANGSFTFNPTPGYEGTTTFGYTITDNEGSTDTGTVSITVTGMIWFVNSTGAAGDGRLTSPFNSLAAFQAVNTGTGNNPAAGDKIFLFENATAYTGPVTLLNNQSLFGQDATVNLATLTGLPQPTYAAVAYPTMNSGNVTMALITTTAASTHAIQIANTASATIRGLSIGNTTGSGIANAGATFGTLTVSNFSDTGTGQALNLINGTLTAAYTTLSSSSSTSVILLSNVSGDLGISNAGSAISGATGADILISGGALSLTYPGTITNTAGRSLEIQNKTGGTVTFSGAISDSGTGIFLNSNIGTTINFTGGLNLSTGANPAFTATGGGTVSATQNNTSIVNTITTTTGTALNVANTTIGPSGLTFRSISSNGAASGIILNSTGSSGGLTITANGGTCSSVATCTGGAIQSSTGPGISLTAVPNGVSLNRMAITNGGDDGIRATSVVGLGLADSIVTNNGNNHAGGAEERGLDYLDVTGTVSILGTTVSGSDDSNAHILNTTSATTTLTVTTSTFMNSKFNTGLRLRGEGSSIMKATITGSTFSQNADPGFSMQTAGVNTPVQHLLFDNNNVSGGSPTNPVSARPQISINSGANNAVVKARITNNHIKPAAGSEIILNTLATCTAASSFDAVVDNNTINDAQPGSLDALGDSGSSIFGWAHGDGPTRITISNNLVQNWGNRALELGHNDGNGTADYTVTGNTFNTPDTGPNHFEGMYAYSGGVAGDASNVCIDMKNNDFDAIGQNGVSDLALDRFATSQLRFAGHNTAVVASLRTYLRSVNASSPALTVETFSNPQTATSASTCAQPVFPPVFPLMAASVPERAEAPAAAATHETALSVAPTPSANLREHANLTARARLLTQSELDAVVATAVDSWQASGLTAEQLARLHRLNFTVADLAGLHLGEADGDEIRIDRNAAGNGWSTSDNAAAGRIDLLTTLMHELGHVLGLDDTYAEHDRGNVMYGFLHLGERRFPLKAQAAGARLDAPAKIHFLSSPLNIGDLPAGKTVTITYVITISSAATSITNQGTVSGGGFANVPTDDPQFGGTQATVTPVNLPPTVSNVARSTNEDAALIFIAPNFTGSYTDPNSDPLATVRITSLPTNGVLKISGADVTTVPTDIAIGSITNLTYAPNANYNGSDSFNWNGSDGQFFANTAATVNLTINSVNDAPTLNAISDPAAINEDAGQQTVSLAGIGTGASNETQTLTVTASSGNTALIPNPTVTYTSPNATGSLKYTPVSNSSGSALITVAVGDNGGTANGGINSFQRTFTVTVNPVNDAPSITGQSPVSTNSSTARTIMLSDLQVSDPDSTYPGSFTLTVSDGVNYSRSGNTITPAANFYGTLSVPVKVNDGALDSNTFNLAVTVNPPPELVQRGAQIQSLGGGDYKISFIGNPGQQYAVQYCDDLVLANWQTIGNPTADANGVFFVVDHPPAGTTQRFYRALTPYMNDFNVSVGAATLRGHAIWTNQAVRLTDDVGGQVGAVVADPALPDGLKGFTVKFNVAFGPSSGTPADGGSFAVGDLGSTAWGEAGAGTAHSLAVSFDTFNNGAANDNIGIHVWVNGAHVAVNGFNPYTSGVIVPVEISFDTTNGLTVKYNSATVFNNLAVSGFVLDGGDRFGIGARTGGATEKAVVDDLQLVPR